MRVFGGSMAARFLSKMLKIKLPSFGRKEEFPDQFFALDLGGKINKVFVLHAAGGVVNAVGSRRIARADSPEEDRENLKQAVAELRADFPDASPTAVVGISGPYSLAFTTVVRSSTSKDVEELVSHAREAALHSAEEELREGLGEPKLKVSEMEAEILEVKEVDKLEVFLFTSFAAEPYLAEQSQLVKYVGLSLWGFSSLHFNLVSELVGSRPAEEGEELNALIFDIGGTKTEVGLVFGGQLMDTKSFWWDFKENGNPATFLDLWMETVSTALSAFEGVEAFPAKIYLAGGAASFPGLFEVAASYPWSRDHHFEVAPEVVPLEEDRLPLSLGQVALRVNKEEKSEESKAAEGELDEEEE